MLDMIGLMVSTRAKGSRTLALALTSHSPLPPISDTIPWSSTSVLARPCRPGFDLQLRAAIVPELDTSKNSPYRNLSPSVSHDRHSLVTLLFDTLSTIKYSLLLPNVCIQLSKNRGITTPPGAKHTDAYLFRQRFDRYDRISGTEYKE